MKKLLTILLFFLPLISLAQITDDFESGTLTNWSQNQNHFSASDSLPINGTYSFHHTFNTNVTANYKDTASCPIGNINLTNGTTTWQFQVKYANTNPSGSNNWNIFLMSDADNSQMPSVNGYVIGVDYGSATDDFLTLRKVSGGTGTIVTKTSFKWDSSATVGIKVTRSSTGDWEVFVDTINGGFDNLASVGTGTSSTFTDASYFGVFYEYTKTNCQKFWLDDLSITGAAGNDSDSQVSAGTDAEPSTISSIINSADGVEVFDVNLKDLGTADGKATIIDSLIFTQGDNNDIADWTNVIAGAKLFGDDLSSGITGTITASGISFAQSGLISIDDNTNENYQLKIWLKTDLSNISDNDKLEFKLSGDDIFCQSTGSSFDNSSTESGDNNCAIDISATKLNFATVPSSIAVNQNFSVKISATDINGNIDADNTSSITLSLNSGSGNLTSASGLSQNLSNGTYTWTDLKYDVKENLTISANSTGLTGATSTTIVCSDYVSFLNDDFEDGDLLGWTESETGHWQASTTDALDGSYSLHQVYDASSSTSDIISHPMNGLDINSDSTIWQFELKYNNSDPSSSNSWNVFLMADANYTEMHTGGNINGYVIGVNFSGSDDYLKLWKIENGTATAIISTNYDWKNTTSSIQKTILVTRSTSGLWTIKIDDNGNADGFVAYGSATDNSLTNADYFGIAYKYSSTKDRLLWLDDIYVGPPIPDTKKPYLTEISVNSQNTIKLTFNEDLDKTSAETVTNYTVDNSIGNPTSAILNSSDKRIVDLTFGSNFSATTNYGMLISGIKDISDNTIIDTVINFNWQNIDIQNLRFISSKEIDIKFTKEVDSATASNPANYVINDTIGAAISAILDASNPYLVHLTFAKRLIYETSYTLTVSNVEDLFGNSIGSVDYNFIFYMERRNDLVINELMVDVSPTPVALPAYKYIEIYNTTSYNLDLTDWTLKIGTSNTLTFPQTTLTAHGYAIICSAEADTNLSIYGQTIPILKESYLTSTTGKMITIKNTKNEIIEQITYDPDNWYQDNDKDNGGWSMERIDPTNFCSQDDNWHASENYTGGTPCMINSVYGSNPDNESPYIENFTLVASQDLILDFSETVDTATTSILSYLLNNSSTPLNAIIDNEDNSIVHLHFIDHFAFSTNTLFINKVSDYCGNAIKDTTITFNYTLIHPTDLEPKSSTQLKIYFSEPASKGTAENVLNYTVDNGIGNPIVAYRDANDTSIVHLLFQNKFTEDSTNILTINGVTDIYGNVMETENRAFTYHVTKPFDIVFNELMVDVNPAPLGLPEVQYVELYNTSDYDIWLSDWVFVAENQDGRVFPTQKIPSKGFALLCYYYYEDKLKEFGTTIPILGTSDLTQTGKELQLFDNNNNLIAHLRYSDSWYNDETKDNGGWSLEKIYPNNFCESSYNWAASIDVSGGTPGRDNSIYAINEDTTTQSFLKLTVKSSNHLICQFTKNINFETGLNVSNYSVNGIGNPQSVSVVDTSYSTVNLYFNNQFADKQKYTLTITNVSDDCGNAIDATTSDFTYHRIHPEYVWVLNQNQVEIKFSENTDNTSALTKANYSIDNQIGNPNYVVRGTDDPSLVYLQFSTNFSDGVTYNLDISGIKDENGNSMNDTTLQFIYYTAKVNDIAINEVLFNPYKGGADFVELYNRSIYPINLKNFVIAKYDDNGQIASPYKISDDNLIFPAKSYLVVTTDSTNVKSTYTTGGKFVQLNTMPAYGDKNGTVIIYDYRDSIIDEFSYNDDMHYALLSNTEGVSLERVDFNQPTQDSSNWHSAAESAGFATPGLKNSQYRDMAQDSAIVGEISLNPEVFSPDNDGYNDQLYINFNFQNGGNFADVLIYDKNGRLIRTLEQDELLGTDGYWIWDGLDDNNNKARIGIYAIIVKVFDLDGKTKIYRLATVVASKK